MVRFLTTLVSLPRKQLCRCVCCDHGPGHYTTTPLCTRHRKGYFSAVTNSHWFCCIETSTKGISQHYLQTQCQQNEAVLSDGLLKILREVVRAVTSKASSQVQPSSPLYNCSSSISPVGFIQVWYFHSCFKAISSHSSKLDRRVVHCTLSWQTQSRTKQNLEMHPTEPLPSSILSKSRCYAKVLKKSENAIPTCPAKM